MDRTNKKKRRKINSDAVARLMVESRQTCNVCWKRKNVQVHHITPVSSEGTDKEDNLILLCPNCHDDVHTNRIMTRNISKATLILYKETWLDLVRRHPFVEVGIAQDSNDINTISMILRHADRLALYLPFELMHADGFFQSIRKLRVEIQSSGYRMIWNATARSHIQDIYRKLVEIEFMDPNRNPKSDGGEGFEMVRCLHGLLGGYGLSILAIRRQEVRFSINELAKLLGYQGYFNDNDQLLISAKDIKALILSKGHKCFGSFDDHCIKCQQCDFSNDCITFTAELMLIYEGSRYKNE